MLGMIGGFMAFIIVAVVILVILSSCIRIVPQAQALVVERLGGYLGTYGVGVHFLIPFIDRVAKKVNLKEQVEDFPPQPVITKDNVTMQIDTVVFFYITDPKMYAYGVERPILAIENLTATTLRNIIGDLELDETLTSRETINAKMQESLDLATDPWGIKVTRVELKNIIPPAAIQDAMEKQMKAERERREAILQAEGQKQSQILVAEGEKQSVILRADAARQAAIMKAEGEAEAIMKVQQATAEALKLLNEANPNEQVVKIRALEAFQAAADGKKQAQILEAEGKAEAILAVQKATADSIRLLNEAGPTDPVIRLRALEAFAAAADGKATKIIIPSEIQGLAGLCASAKAVFDGVEPNKPKAPAQNDASR